MEGIYIKTETYEQMKEQLRQLSAALAAKDEALRDYHNATGLYVPALSLQPHASLVAKIKADAVLEFASEYADHREYFGETIKDDAQEYADRIEKGEA